MSKNKLFLLLALLLTAATGAWAQRLYLEVDGTAATLKYSANEADYSGKPSFTGTTWQNASGFKASVKTITVDASCENFAGDKLQGLFATCSVLTSVTGLGTINTTNVTTMQQMFNNCSKLETVNLSGLNTANVTTMQQMFFGCSALTSVDLSGLNTANVTDMKNMFYNCSKLETVDLSGFNTSSVTNMSNMFQGCAGLQTLDLSGFNTSSVTSMSYMFSGCSKLETVDLSGFNTANVTDMKNMFSACTGLKSVNFSGLNTSGVTTMTYMFQGCTGLQTLDLSDLNTSSVTDMRDMFHNCTGLQTLDISSFNTGNVTKMGSMFNGCSQLTAIFVGDGWSVASSANSMFTDCTNLPNWDGTSDGTKAYYGGDGKGYLTYKVDGPPASTYTVSMKDGVKDADKWTVKVGDGQAQALPIGGLKGDGKETVTIQYNGRLKVKGVKATSDAEPAVKPAATVTTAPTGAAIVGVGKTTALVSGGVAEGGTMMYKVTTENTKPASTDGFSDAVPTAEDITASGKVYVWYYVKGDDTHSDSEIAATAIEVPVADVVDLSTLTENTELKDGNLVTGTLAGNYKITIADGATVTLDGAVINGTNSSKWAGLTLAGDGTIILSGENSVKGFYEDYPGIFVPANKTLTIQGDGSLNVSSNGYGAGIGGGYEIASGNITIEGGTVTATGGRYAAGIGGGSSTSCGAISITGGTVTASGGQSSPGIGSGSSTSCSAVTIANTVTSVTAYKGENATISIGPSYNGSCGTVTIGGTKYWENNAAVNGGDTYLAQSPLIYDPSN